MESSNNIAEFVKLQRQRLNLTQEALAEKAGVGLRFIRDLEQGKTSLQLDKINQVLALFGKKMLASRGIEAAQILFHYMGKPVKVYFDDGKIVSGMFYNENWENGEIKSWDFIKDTDLIKFQQSNDKNLITQIPHSTIQKVELI